jgi:RHS repeat-associated protein
VWQQPALGANNSTANGRNQIAALNGANFTYDARGNLTATGAATYGYDVFNRLTSAGSATLAYDPVGRLYQTVGSGVTTRFLYDGLDAIAEYNASNVMQRRYVHGPGVDEPLLWYEGAGTTDRRFIMQDQLGSVIAHTDASGALIGSPNSYDEYGAPGAGNVGRFQYTGQMWLGEAQLYHYRARAYAPGLGRFLQSDPILYAGGMNLYAYVGNDPVNARDPTGLGEDKIVVTAPMPTLSPEDYAVDYAVAALWESHWAMLNGAALSAFLAAHPEFIVEDEIVVTGERPPHVEFDPLLWLRATPWTIGFAAWGWQDTWTQEEICQDAPLSPGCATEPDPHGCQRNQDNEIARCQGLGLTPSERSICYANANERFGECLAGGGLGGIRTPIYRRGPRN